MKKVLALVLGTLLGVSLFAEIPENSNFWSDYPDEELAQFIVERMSDAYPSRAVSPCRAARERSLFQGSG